MPSTRRIVQFAFLALTLAGVFALGANVEAWCPFGGVEALYTYAVEGNMICSLGTSNFYILGGTLAAALLVRRAFCGYVCPIGTISDWLQGAARRVGLPELKVSGRLDRSLRALKYAALAAILYFTYRAGELLFRGYDPCYALISRHGADITHWAYVAAGAVVAASLFLRLPFCRWVCPLAAAFHPFSRLGLMRVRREEDACTGCGKCSRACPMAIDVDRAANVTAARCIGCLQCVETCPRRNDGALSWGLPRRLGGRLPAVALPAILLACLVAAAAGAYLYPMPSFVKTHGQAPAETATLELNVEELTCRGRGQLLVWFLQRDDAGPPLRFFRLEAWPGPGAAPVRIVYDPRETDPESLRRAMTEPYFEVRFGTGASPWRESPFRIAGYDPTALGP